MIESVKNTLSYQSLKLSELSSHAVLFYSQDKELNNNVALNFAKALVCKNKNGCGLCPACLQFNKNSHPDVYIINQSQIKVEDANLIISKLNTTAISGDIKVFVILNAENMNETAQNKLLKSFEEPNESTVFVLSCCKTDKLLPTILSRLNKIYVPKLNFDDKLKIADELKQQNMDISKYLNLNLTLTEMMNFCLNSTYQSTLAEIKKIFTNLKSSQDIPMVVSNIKDVDKALFLPILQDIILDCLNSNNKFDNETKLIFKSSFNEKALIKCLPLIEDAFKKQNANVNFSYILDNLLFNMLKEKFLCR